MGLDKSACVNRIAEPPISRATLTLSDCGRVADQLHTICEQAGGYQTTRPAKQWNGCPRDGAVPYAKRRLSCIAHAG